MEHREDPASGRAFHSADLSPLSLDELAVLSQAGDERASVALWRASDGIARRIARTWGVDDEHEWREALNDAFMVCHESWDPERASFPTFLSIVFRHVLGNGRKREARWHARRAVLEELGEVECYNAWSSHDVDRADYEISVLHRAATATVDEFESATRRCLEHRRWAQITQLLLIEKLSNVDIAARLDIPVKHVHNCVSRHVRPATRRHAVEIRRADACIEETNQEPVNED